MADEDMDGVPLPEEAAARLDRHLASFAVVPEPGHGDWEEMDRWSQVAPEVGEIGPGSVAEGVVECILDLAQPAGDLGARIAEHLSGQDVLFRRDGGPEVVARTIWGTWERMEPVWFATWLALHGVRTRGRGEMMDVPETIGARILRADRFLAALPVLRGHNQVRLPVFRGTGADRRIELLPTGYDDETGIWTDDGLSYPDDWEADDAREWFDGLLRTFPWGDEHRMAVQYAAMATCFCRDLFAGRPPMFIWNSNLAGSGKSTLARLALRMVFGRALPLVLDQRNAQELEKGLNTQAIEHAPAVWFDDVVGRIFHPHLRVWITEAWRGGRVLGGNTSFGVAVRAVTFVTGAQLTTDEHLARRALWVDLFPDQVLADRVLPADAVQIDETWMMDVENRRKFLAAMWAAVKHWEHCGFPGGSRVLPSMEGWSEVVPGIVAAMGWGDCLRRFEAPDAGDLDSTEARDLVEAVIRAYGQRGQCTAVDIIAVARSEGLFKHVLGDLDLLVADLDARPRWRWRTTEPDGVATEAEKREQAARWRDSSVDSKWGKVWKRLAVVGLRFRIDGTEWKFGARHTRHGNVYELESF